MYQTITKSDFTAAFHRANRGDNFSREALGLLFYYLEDLEEQTGEPIEFDVIAICCEYSENNAEYLASNYKIDIEDAEGDEDEIKNIVLDYLNDETIVIGETSTGIVYADF